MNAQEIFTKAGLRPTKARLAVLNTIADADNALSHPEILARVTTQKEFDRVTIYRVLDWLSEHQLIHKISGDNRAWKFQLSQHSDTKNSSEKQHLGDNHQHAHLHCTECGNISCVHELAPDFSNTVLSKYKVKSIDINIKGVCEVCNK